MVPSGRGTSAIMNSRNGEISGMLLVRVYAIDFFRLSNINRPAAHAYMHYVRVNRRRNGHFDNFLAETPTNILAAIVICHTMTCEGNFSSCYCFVA